MIFRFSAARLALVLFSALATAATAQVNLSGRALDEAREPLIGANVVVLGTATGTTTDFDGNFRLEVPSVPTQLLVSYIGYEPDTVLVENGAATLEIVLGDNATEIAVVEVKGRRISERRQQSALTMETLDNIAIKETPAANFYDGLGSLKDVDLTAASLGFKIINTRGFNSTNPVRSLQIIDGVDNQSPGLNFSLGNFLGASDLDVNAVNIIVGASSAFYGPNAFNGVIAMETKDPFLQQGLSATVKAGERNLIEGGFRWAQALKNRDGEEWFAYKLNAYGFRADDWVADNYEPITDSDVPADNFFGFDAVNVYGDEEGRDLSNAPFLGTVFQEGYREIDLVDYDSENLKLNATAHFRLQPELNLLSPEIIASTSYSTGTTIYQGDNRFSLRDIEFYQHRLEFRKRDRYFLRVYGTHEDAGSSYDPYFTALLLQRATRPLALDGRDTYGDDYDKLWRTQIVPRIGSSFGDAVPRREEFPRAEGPGFDAAAFREASRAFTSGFPDSFALYDQLVRQELAINSLGTPDVSASFVPGTARFDSAFNAITSRLSGDPDGGTRLFDRSALVHGHGEYRFTDLVSAESGLTDLDLRMGGNYRAYLPDSKGTVLADTISESTGERANINTYEYGVYGGGTATFFDQLKLSGSLRLDKHENFDYLLSPAASLVYNPEPTTTIRASFSSAIRNPTLADQYLFYNVGRAILLGNLNGFDSLVTVESLLDFNSTADLNQLNYFDVDPIRPEKVRTAEVGVRTTLFEKLFLDATYYYSYYEDFIGFNIGIVSQFAFGRPINPQVYRVAANASDQVTTQGFSIGSNYYFGSYFAISGNYSWNVLNTETDDPIIPAFNTPEHKYNIGLAARDIPLGASSDVTFGFNTNYKWVDGFIFEGSPQFTGFIPAYGLLDAQANVSFPSADLTLKVGASNVLDNQVFQTYGGPRIGRLAYASLLYEFRK